MRAFHSASLLLLLVLVAGMSVGAPVPSAVVAQQSPDTSARGKAKPFEDWGWHRDPFTKDALLTPATPAWTDPPRVSREVLRLAFDFEDWLNLDSDAVIRRIAGAIATAPSDPAVLALIHTLQETLEEAELPDEIGGAVRAAVAAKGGSPELALGGNARYLLDSHYEIAIRQGQWEEARAIERSMLGLQSWLVAGPFAPRGGGDVTDLSFAPERLCQVAEPWQGVYGAVEWTPFEPERPNDSRVNPADMFVDSGNGWYMLTEVVNPGPKRNVLLDVEAGSGGFRAWLGGQLVMHRRQSRDLSRDDATVVELPTEATSLLIKLGSSTTCTVRICDPVSRLVLPSIAARIPTSDVFRPFVPSGSIRSLDRRIPAAFQRLAAAHLAQQPGSELRAMCGVVLAFVMSDAGVPELAEDYWNDCREWREADPLRDACLGYWYFDRPTVASPARERLEMRARLERMLELRPRSIRPRLELARILAEERQDTEAARMFEDTAKIRPHWRIHALAADFYRTLGWDAEASHHERMLGELAGSLHSMRQHAEVLFKNGDLAGSARVLDAALGRWPGSSTLIWRRFSIAIERGEFDLAGDLIEREVLRAGGEGRDQLNNRVRLAVAQGRWEEAYRTLLDLGDTARRDGAEMLAGAAMLAESRGESGMAEQAWRLLLHRWPGDDRAHRALRLLSGKPLTELPGHMTRVDHELLWQVEASQFPAASAAVVLDEQVWRIWPDGGGEVYGQRVTKILSLESIDWYGRAFVPGEVIRARTLLPDDTVAEPATVTGNRFEFPRIAPGVATDVAWRETFRGDGWRTLHGRSFSFASNDLTTPTLQSRLVIELPPGMQVSFDGVQLDRVVVMRVAREDGGTVLTFECNQPRSIRPEALMPRTNELIPSVTFYAPDNGSVGKVARRFVDELSDPQDTWLVRRTAQEIGRSIVESGRELTVRSFAEAAFHWVNQEIRTAGAGFHPHATLVDRQGNRQDLFVALLDAAGLDWQMLRLTGSQGLTVSSDYDSPSFPWTLVQIREESGELLHVDMVERMASFGSVRRQMAGSRSIAVDPKDLSWELGNFEPALREDDGYHLDARIELSADPEATANISGSIKYSGEPAFSEKEYARNTPRERLLLNTESDLSASFTGLSLTSLDPGDLEERGTPYVRQFGGTLSGLLQDTGDGLAIDLPLELFSGRYRQAVSLPERRFDLLLASSFGQSDTVTLIAPAGMAWAGVPESLQLIDPAFSYAVNFEVAGSELKIERKFRVYQRRVPVGDYPAFRRRILQIDALESAQFILKPTASTE